MCSRICQGECAAPLGFSPCWFAGQSFITLSKSKCASPPLRSSTRCSFNDFCFFILVFLPLFYGSNGHPRWPTSPTQPQVSCATGKSPYYGAGFDANNPLGSTNANSEPQPRGTQHAGWPHS